MKKLLACILLCLCLPAVFAAPAAPARAAEAEPPAADGFTEIWDRPGLEAIAGAPDGRYRLMAHIDMGGAPWRPIPFSGVLDGGGFALYNLTITEADPQTAVSVDGNRKPYDTVFAALFSRCVGATIQNLALPGANVALDTDQNAFAAALVGYGENVTITGCSVGGRVALAMAGRMCGVAGIMGFGYGAITGCSANVELTLVDGNTAENCEEFMGAVLASGYADIEGCAVRLDAYTSVHGYVHNGGVAGMYYVHTDDTGHAGYVRGNTVEATIRFFEDVASRRAYSAPVIGEQLHWVLEIANNTVQHFESIESRDYTTPLLPESCAAPAYAEAVTPPGCQSFGFTTHTCAGCGHSYTDAYTAPAHSPGPWQVAVPAAAGQNGTEQQLCALCGEVAAQREIVPAAGCTLQPGELALAPGESARLQAGLSPDNVSDTGLVFASSDEAVATVDAEGLVTARGPGRATITCTSADGFASAACALTVASPFPWGWAAAGGAALLAVAGAAAAIAVAARRRRRRTARRAHRSLYGYRRR